MKITLDDLNQLMTGVKRRIKEDNLSFTLNDCYLLIGKEEGVSVDDWAYSPIKKPKQDKNFGEEIIGLTVIRTKDKSLFQFVYPIEPLKKE